MGYVKTHLPTDASQNSQEAKKNHVKADVIEIGAFQLLSAFSRGVLRLGAQMTTWVGPRKTELHPTKEKPR
jgi:hypothetical protein